MRSLLLLALAAAPAAAQQRVIDVAPVAGLIAAADARPDFNKALRASVDRLPAAIQRPDMGLSLAQAKPGSVKAEADRLAVGLFAHPEALLYHREELVDTIGPERVRNLEFAVEAYHEAAVKNPTVLSRLKQLRESVDLSDVTRVEDMIGNLAKAFDKSDARGGPGKTVKGKAGKQLRRLLKPARGTQARPRAQVPPPAVYEDDFIENFMPDEETGQPNVYDPLLKPYLPTAQLHLTENEDGVPLIHQLTLLDTAAPGPHGAH